MVEAIKFDRSFTTGIYDSSLGISFGWACITSPPANCIPVWNETKDVCLMFYGEHFAESSELNRLRSLGHDISQESAKYLVHLYEESGSSFLEALNGTFSGLLIDLRRQKAILFNDRFGLGRIYYHESSDAFYFASEAKALLRLLPDTRTLDPKSFGEFFTCGCALQNRTLFTRVSLLPAGSAWEFSHDLSLRKGSYFSRDSWETQPMLPATAFYESLRDTIERIIPKYFQGPQRVAVSLTGGLDSRLIMAWAPPAPYRLRCYTFSGLNRECADVRIARRVAKVSQQYHEVVSLNRKFFAEFPGLAKRSVYFTDGAMDVSGSVELFVNRLAREIAPVRLTGNYGDEVLRQNVALKASYRDQSLFSSDFRPILNDALSCYTDERSGNQTSFIAFKQVPWHHYGRRALEQTQLTVRSPFLDNDLVRLLYRAPQDLAKSVDVALKLIADGDPRLASFPTDRGHMGSSRGIASSIRQFIPALSTRAEYAYDYGMPQRLARLDRLCSPLRLERVFLGRNKFYHFRSWYRDELAGYVKEVLLDPRTLSRGYLQPRRVEHIVNAHLGRTGNYTLEIHKLLTSEIIQRQLIEQRH